MSGLPIRISIALVVVTASSMLAACSRQPETTAPTPPQTEQTDVATFAIGDLSAMPLRDGALDLPNDNKVFGVGRTAAEVAALLTDAGLPSDKLSLSIQPLLVKTADRVLLFDTGTGGDGRLNESLASARVDHRSITDVFISHSHFDHIGGLLDAQGAPAFPAATIHISSPEWTFLRGSARHQQLATAMAPRVAEFTPGADIIPGVVKAVEIRGHTPGHSGYLITSGQSSLLYIGDAMHHFVVSVQRPNWTIAFDGDAPTAEASRSALLTRSAADGQRLYAVHFPFPGIGKVERRGDEFIWVAE